MFRKRIAGETTEKKDQIRWRSHEISRIEAFSDAVFAFAITLLIVALEVPEDYEALMASMKLFFPFAICFAILLVIWYTQNIFFRRYGLNDVKTIVLNGILLFTCLFYVYPLKFLFSSLFTDHLPDLSLTHKQFIYYIYSGGFTCIFILFGLMYRHARSKKEKLELTEEEAFETGSQMYTYFMIASVGLVSMLIASIGGAIGAGIVDLAGAAYILIWPFIALTDRWRAKVYQKKFGNIPVVDVPEEMGKVSE